MKHEVVRKPLSLADRDNNERPKEKHLERFTTDGLNFSLPKMLPNRLSTDVFIFDEAGGQETSIT